MHLPLGGGTPRVLFTPPSSQDPIVVVNPNLGLDADAAYVGLLFFMVGATPPAIGAQLIRVPLDGGATKVIFETSDAIDVGPVAVRGGWVHFSSPATPGLAKVNRCGCTGH